MHVYDALSSRRSVRKFHPTPVPRATIERIIAAALRAPSGSNTQPWKVYAVAGEARERVVTHLLGAAAKGWEHRTPEYQYYPHPWIEPYLGRRRKVGFDLYKAAGIGKDDAEGRRQQALDNFRFFGAPVGLFLTIDRRMAAGSYIDAGMFLQSILLAARAEGLDTCAQAIFCWLHEDVRAVVGIPEGEILLCGVSLGHGDHSAAVNQFPTERVSVAETVTFQGFA
jgi:nitroreductase